jgi:basic membrane protein A
MNIHRFRHPSLGVVVSVVALTLTACAQGASSSSSATSSPSTSTSAAANKAILIGNQPFGDRGPMDDMASALNRCQTEYGFETKKLVALSPSDYESTIRAAAQEGYPLIMTTFPQMTAATVAVAKAFPNTKFAAIYQFINSAGKTPEPNIWDSSFDNNAPSYIQGVIAAKLSKTGKLGFIIGAIDPTIVGSLNAFIQGAKAENAKVQVQWANANTFIDPAKGKDLALAMISRGVDVLSTSAAQTQLGALDAAKAAGILFFGDSGDNSALYPKGYISDESAMFGQNVIDACKAFSTGKFQGGTPILYNLSNNGSTLDTKLITKWGDASGRSAEATALVTTYNDLATKINSGAIKVVSDPNPPKS